MPRFHDNFVSNATAVAVTPTPADGMVDRDVYIKEDESKQAQPTPYQEQYDSETEKKDFDNIESLPNIDSQVFADDQQILTNQPQDVTTPNPQLLENPKQLIEQSKSTVYETD